MDDISVTLVPEKIGNPNAMQISFTQDNQFRSIYVFAEDSQVGALLVDCIYVFTEDSQVRALLVDCIYVFAEDRQVRALLVDSRPFKDLTSTTLHVHVLVCTLISSQSFGSLEVKCVGC